MPELSGWCCLVFLCPNLNLMGDFMKKIVIAILAFTFALAIFSGCTSQATEDQNHPVFSVNDVQDDPLAFTGVITIHGVVTMHMPNGFGMEHTRQRPCCPEFVLHVAYNGTAPTVGTTVYATGSFDHVGVLQTTQVRAAR